MIVIDQYHTISDPSPLLAIPLYQRCERAGRVCYQSTADPTDTARTREFIRKIVSRGHESVLEHASITVRFVTDRGVSHELVRHRLASYSQESTRYCSYGGGLEVVRPVWLPQVHLGEYDVLRGEHEGIIGVQHRATGTTFYESPLDPAAVWLCSMAAAEQRYRDLLEAGWAPQQARAVLPHSLKTTIVVTANLREWRHILRLRTDGKAHPQIRELLLPLLRTFQAELPEVFEDIQ